MANVNPNLILLFSGKRKSGKDYVTDALHERLDGKNSVIVKLSGPIKKEFAVIHDLSYDRLLTSDNYKEMYRQEMISWSERMRHEDPGIFIRSAITMFYATNYPIWIVSDMRRKSDLAWFRENFPNVLYTVMIKASEDVRISRGWTFTAGVDDVESECDLDDANSWDMVIHNNGGNLDEELDHLLSKCESHLKEERTT